MNPVAALLMAAFFLNAYGQAGKVTAGNNRLIALAGRIGLRIFSKKGVFIYAGRTRKITVKT